jgi:spermidine synthase
MFGITIYAVTIVVAAFMAGLALGSYLFGKYIDKKKNPLNTYILLELGIGLYAILFPFIIKKAYLLYVFLSKHLEFSFFMHNSGMLLLGFIILLVPTTLMGATLPVLARFMVKRVGQVGGYVGMLYALNTYGGVAGVLASVYILIPSAGLVLTTYFAVLINFAVAIGFVMINQRIAKNATSKLTEDKNNRARAEATKHGKTNSDSDGLLSKPVIYMILLAFGLSGFASLAYEILWTRMLIPVFGIHVYAFAVVLATFLYGIATGSLIFSNFLNNKKRLTFMFALVELCIGLGAILSLILFNYINVFGMYSELAKYFIILIPAVFMGISFPLVSKILGRNTQLLGKTVGNVYSINTFGGIIGTFAAGFLFLNFLKIQTSVLLVSVINFALCIVLLMMCKNIKRALKHTLIIIVIAVMLSLPLMNTYLSRDVFKNAGENLLYYKEGVSATVDVSVISNSPGRNDLIMQINGRGLGSTDLINAKAQRLLAHIPLLHHPDPEKILFVGLGTGMSAGVATLYPVKAIDVVEISPEVVEASQLFSNFNYNLSKDIRYNLILDDARNYLLKTDQQYDVISAEPMDPFIAGSGNLFTKEYFELVKKRLRPGGVAAQWVPMYRVSNSDFKTIIRTFTSVFPHTTAWLVVNEIILIGSDTEIRINQDSIKKAFEDVKITEDLKIMNISNKSQLLSIFLFNETALKEYAGNGRLNTDDFPFLDYSTPKASGLDTIPENIRSIEEFKKN